MEDQEMREWKKKEDDIKKCIFNQNLGRRIKSVANCLDRTRKRHRRRQYGTCRRNQNKKERTKEQADRQNLKKKNQKYDFYEVLRKLLKSRKEQDVNKRKRDIIEEYSNFGSKVLILSRSMLESPVKVCLWTRLPTNTKCSLFPSRTTRASTIYKKP